MTVPLILPPVFLDRLQKLIPEDKKETVYNSFLHPRVTGIRVNTINTSTKEVLSTLKKQGFSFTPLTWFPDGFIFAGDKNLLQETEEYKKGKIYFQSLSSMLVPLVLDPHADETILDMCASPGSKTTEIAALMKNTGKIIANDRSRERLFKLRENLKTLEIYNTDVINLPGEMLWRRFPEVFDRVLVDVPCSMEGRFISEVEKTYKDWSPKKSKLLSQMQKNLLRSAVSCTKPGGIIVYSTCTLSIEENEEVVNWILKKEPTLTVEKISLDIPEEVPGFVEYGKKVFDPRLIHTRRILPSETMEGFFIAKLRKNS
jgi:16S rRNA (cytosine1407-C5)-methyltransferase